MQNDENKVYIHTFHYTQCFENLFKLSLHSWVFSEKF